MHSLAAAFASAVWMASAILGPNVSSSPPSSSRPSIGFVILVALLFVVTGILAPASLSSIAAITTISLFAHLSAPSQPILAPSQPLGLLFRIAKFLLACLVFAYHVAVPNVGSSVFASRLDGFVSQDAARQDANSRCTKLGDRFVISKRVVNELNRKIRDIGLESFATARSCKWIFPYSRRHPFSTVELQGSDWEEPSLFTKMCKYFSHPRHPLSYPARHSLPLCQHRLPTSRDQTGNG